MAMSHADRGKLGSIASMPFHEKEKGARVKKYLEKPKTCKGLSCTSVLSYEKRFNSFCSQSCSATFHNTGKVKVKKKVCLRECCGVLAHKVFCSFECSVEHKKDLRKKDFASGKLKSGRAKKVLIELHGLKCMDCGWAKINPISKKCPVELEHLDGNSDNNLPSNLKLLCPNCHSLTPTYKALNVGKGRAFRRERYKAGKSY